MIFSDDLIEQKVFYDVSNNTIGLGIWMLTWPNSL